MYRHFVWKVVEQLPERQRQAIELLYREEKKLLEAAKEMKISVEGVKKLRSRGIDEIRKKINARGVDLMREIFASYSSTAAIVLLVLLICFMSM
jgi:DNA-directed RNA polymerase specialized sigma24 family protein